MSIINCQVHSLVPLTEFVYKVLLKPEHNVDFLPGQYLNFIMSDDDKRAFSIASAPKDELIELQIGAFGADSYPMQVIEKIQTSKQVQVEMPLGQAHLRDSERPLLLIAGGTGFSYIKSMFEQLVHENSQRKVVVYWGLREESASYELEKTQATIQKLTHGEFHPVIENAHNNWQGKTGMVHQVVMADISDLSLYDIYLAGRFDMVGVVRTDFVAKGALIDRMYADAFAFI
ncbi:NAD(P)H-flavin reductase [Thalassotalea piscium]|uniref:Aquacobalamin reductase/NAD(P)H-flavin reductase n=1 Tax=Thalassotalea piscium TaxID=1230533 RepID=A0A7X0NFU3_9GAMM|nr:NAD(P)H-flavin reductase [Thalassotalea piscium]MBB6542600.1 aquacobalamin reductase/NAD(P)H-flavin reductase [Thalassotalea piscium]